MKQILNDSKFIYYQNIKNKYSNEKYLGGTKYGIFRRYLYKLFKDNGTVNGNIYYSKIYSNTENKLISEYIEQLKKEILIIKENHNIDIMEELKRLLKITQNKYNDIPKNEVEEIFYTYWIFERYLGFAFEYLLVKILENKGFCIRTNKYFDDNYKIDLVISHKWSKRAIGIQCKSYTYLNNGNEVKENHINGMKKFKEEGFQYLVTLPNIVTNIETYYILHKDLEVCCCNGNSLISSETIKNYNRVDKNNINIDLLINEISKKLEITLKNI